MEIRPETKAFDQIHADCLAVGVFEDEKKGRREVQQLDRILGGTISELKKDGEIKGKQGEVTLIHTRSAIPSKRVAVVGLGKQSDCDMEKVRFATASLVTRLRGSGVDSIASTLLGMGSRKLDVETVAQAVAEGAILGGYTFERYRKTERPAPALLALLLDNRAMRARARRGISKGSLFGRAQNLARDLANEPSSDMTPTILAETAGRLARDVGLKMSVLGEEEAKKEGMGAFLGVARGTDEPAKVIVLRYRPSDSNPLALVGKGITFDSGGISIKPSLNMHAMKADMSGAAAVLGAMWAIAQLKPKMGVLGVIPATENMPSGHAMKPGDVVRSMSGQTVEVVNTDAEGRLALADAITYAKKLGATAVVDVATLTGACIIALGEFTSGLMSNSDRLANLLLKISVETGEKVWRLPLFEEYGQQLKSDIADMKNSGGRPAGTITAGMFLKKFAQDTPWAHIDIAGKEIVENPSGYKLKGATGVCTRTLIEFALRMAGK
jgi:leucyl aminopeptidase